MKAWEYKSGVKFRVLQNGAYIYYQVPAGHGSFTYARTVLEPGTVITCLGKSMTWGDGVPAVKWARADGTLYGGDAIFHPFQGGMWEGHAPEDGWLEPVTEGSS